MRIEEKNRLLTVVGGGGGSSKKKKCGDWGKGEDIHRTKGHQGGRGVRRNVRISPNRWVYVGSLKIGEPPSNHKITEKDKLLSFSI